MEISLRKINVGDSEEVAQLSKQLGYEVSIEQTKYNITATLENKHCQAYVAIFENKVVGWIFVAHIILIESPAFCEIRGLVVDDKYRRHNIGKLLVEKVKQWCKEKSDKLRVRCNVKRKDAHTFYEHVGFTEKKEQKVFEIGI
jgi:GNAT superfamily N-acetyltransferase